MVWILTYEELAAKDPKEMGDQELKQAWAWMDNPQWRGVDIELNRRLARNPRCPCCSNERPMPELRCKNCAHQDLLLAR